MPICHFFFLCLNRNTQILFNLTHTELKLYIYVVYYETNNTSLNKQEGCICF